MNEFFTCLFSNNGMAYGTGVIIFLITLFLVYTRVIGFALTILFLLFALGASLAVAHQSTIKNYFDNLNKKQKTDVSPSKQEGNHREDNPTFKEKMQKAYDDLKSEFETYKEKAEDYIRENKQEHKEKENSSPEQKTP